MHSTRYTLHLQVIMIVVVPAKMYPANFKWTMEHWLYMRYEFFSSHNVLYGGWLSMLFSEDVQINLTNLITHTHTHVLRTTSTPVYSTLTTQETQLHFKVFDSCCKGTCLPVSQAYFIIDPHFPPTCQERASMNVGLQSLEQRKRTTFFYSLI